MEMKHIYKEMKHLSVMFLVLLQLFTFTSCVEEEEYANTPTGNFEALWRIMDEHYCFFDLKQKELGVDWNNIHARYSSQVSDAMNNEQLFEFLSNMIGELQDGHVNISASFDYGRNWAWKEDYPTNFSDTIQRKYLGTDYKIACGLKYRILENNIGYSLMHLIPFLSQPSRKLKDSFPFSRTFLILFCIFRISLSSRQENSPHITATCEMIDAFKTMNTFIFINYILI